jgi:hypothetical protein
LKQQNKRRSKFGLKFFIYYTSKKDFLSKGVFKCFVQYWMTSCVLEILFMFSGDAGHAGYGGGEGGGGQNRGTPGTQADR